MTTKAYYSSRFLRTTKTSRVKTRKLRLERTFSVQKTFCVIWALP